MPKRKKYLVYDGVLFLEDSPLFSTQNRAFRYGDGFFETIRFHKGLPLFWDDHYKRILQAMAVFRFSISGFPTKENLKSSITNLVTKNRIFSDARVRLSIFRKGAGLYSPDTLNASWLIETTALSSSAYSFPQKGLLIDVYKAYPKLPSPSSAFKTIYSLPYILASIHKNDNNVDDSLIINGNGKIIESSNSNLFWYNNSILYTPLISSGCIEGIFRSKILEAAKALDITVEQTAGADESELLNSEEIFLSNCISGIQWVAGFKERRFYAMLAKKLHDTISHHIKEISDKTN